MEWDKLVQNPFLAFYRELSYLACSIPCLILNLERWPWLCPNDSIEESLEINICSMQLFFCLSYYHSLLRSPYPFSILVFML